MAMGAFNPAAMGMGAGMGCGAAGLAMMFQQQQPKQNFSVNGMMNLPGMGMGVPVNSKKQRELYVGNLPPGVTEPMMKELFTQVLGACEGFDGSLGPTVLNVQLCGGGTYAFIEFRDEQCCESCMQFTGMVISGKPLKVHAHPPFCAALPSPHARPLTYAASLFADQPPEWLRPAPAPRQGARPASGSPRQVWPLRRRRGGCASTVCEPHGEPQGS